MKESFHFLVNTYRPDAVEAAAKTASGLVARGFHAAADSESAAKIGTPAVTPEQFADCSLCLAFGGDGTLIKAAHLCSKKSTPILGIYFGSFGFVTQCQGDDLENEIDTFLAGKSQFEDRMMLQTELRRQGTPVANLLALNEVVVQRSVGVRMLMLNVKVDGTTLTTYPADGVLVSTPTGSTGYNLSAGGPILDPRVEALVLSAIAPHTLSARPLVLGPESVITLSLDSGGGATMSADNRSHLHVLPGDELVIQRSPFITKLIKARENDFLFKLSHRLFWSQHVLGEKQ